MMRRVRCLTPGCQRLVKGRGVCGCCYHRHNKSVTEGETTWAQLESEGKTDPAVGKREQGDRLYREMTAKLK